jgi:hypothetical protein
VTVRTPRPFTETAPTRPRPACQQQDISYTASSVSTAARQEQNQGVPALRFASLGDARDELLEAEHVDSPLVPELRQDVKHPRSVLACHYKRWYIAVWPEGGSPSSARLIRYRCLSRRHPGPCRDHWRRMVFARLRDGQLHDADPCEVAFVTFTMDSEFHRRVSESLRARAHHLITTDLGRWLDGMNMAASRSGQQRLAYFWAREETQRGVPHLHMVLRHPWARACMEYDATLDWHPAPDFWQSLAASGGVFGRMDASRAYDLQSVQGYVAKIASRVAGELTKDTQTPEAMDLKTRTFGASRDFLAPITKSKFTGELLNSGLSRVDGKPRTCPADLVCADSVFVLDLMSAGLPVTDPM